MNDLIDINNISQLSTQAFDIDAVTPDYFVMHYREFLGRYISKGNPSEDTMNKYCVQIDKFIRWCLQNKKHPLAMVDYHIRLYRDWLINQNYKNESMHMMLAAVKAFYMTATKMGLIKENPSTDVTVPNSYYREGVVSFYTPEQMGEVISVFDTEKDAFIRYRNKLILYLMGVEGLRNVEVHRACVEDVNWDMNIMMVRGKGAKGRMEPIYPCEETFELLRNYILSIPVDREIKRDGNLTPLILSSSHRNDMGRISRNGIRLIMNKALEAANLKHPGYSCHVFRHSCGTNLYENTKDLRVVQETLRQKDPKVTARYAHVSQKLSNRVTASVTPVVKKQPEAD